VDTLIAGINITEYEAGKVLVQSSFEDHREVVETAHTVSVLDIIGRSRIKYPSRSMYCRHINVFDLKIWLTMNEKEKKWTCPICTKRLQLEDLYIDGYFKSIFEKISEETEVTEICVHPSGEWTIPQVKVSQTTKKIIIDLTHLESDDEQDFTKIYIKEEPNLDKFFFPSI